MLRLRAQAAAPVKSEKTAVILVWLRGGASHLETFDPKPESPSAFRGPYNPIATRVPGLNVCELLPRLATVADKYTIIRSMAHSGGGHPSGSLQVLTGDKDANDKPGPIYPDWMTIANYLRRDPTRTIPNYIGVNAITRYDSFTIAGSAYLGPSYDPFNVTGDPNHPTFSVPNIGLSDDRQAARLKDRIGLRQSFDQLRRDIDAVGMMQAVDDYESQALNLLLSPATRDAFDLNRENPELRDKYGRNQWGQQCLLARRLVEAGVEIITTTFDGPLCARVANWDDHPVNHNVFEALKFRLPFFDQAITALIEDLYNRGLDKRVLLIVTGEFGRTPRISYVASSGGGVASAPLGTVQPGRDHWPAANSMLFAGGGIKTAQVIGATDTRGEEVVERRFGPGDFLATIYRHLGIDAPSLAIPDFQGRPIPILTDGAPIPELSAVG
jgi:hypothetical protein